MNISQALTGKTIDIRTEVEMSLRNEQKQVIEQYNECVSDIESILELPTKPIIFVANSNGKDSFLVTLATLQAYKNCLQRGTVETSRKLIICTVNTLVEAIPMVMLNNYVIPRIQSYAAQSCGINLDYQELTPPLNDEFFIRWGGASKLVTNATRSGDCTTVLKMDVSNRYLSKLTKGLSGEVIVNVTGQRNDESTRRLNNMRSQGVSTKNASDIENELEETNMGLLKFAPIRNWTTEQVFMFHELAGAQAVMKSLLSESEIIESPLNNHSLLLEIYGNGANDVCAVVAGEKQGQGCGGKARFGCHVCTVVTQDKSSESLAKYPRWSTLGIVDSLRVRDWLLRISSSVNARAFHAKSIDPVGFHRICLQPNVLKATHLEAMVWYASQLACDSELRASKFKALVEQKRELEHEGYADIYYDQSLSDDVRTEMLKMYKEVAQKPLFTTYSAKHAALQSIMWNLFGVTALPFRPMAIWDKVSRGERRPYPLSKTEYEAKVGPTSLRMALPDARVMPVYTEEYEATFNPLTSPHYLTFHQRPFDSSDIYEEDLNCSLRSNALASQNLKATVNMINGEVSLISASIAGKNLPASSYSLLERDILDAANTLTIPLLENDVRIIELALPNFKSRAFQFYLSQLTKKEDRRPCKTERVIKRTKGGVLRLNTRLRFYKAEHDCKYRSKTTSKSFYELNFDTENTKAVSFTDVSEEDFDHFSNIHIDDDQFEDWLQSGGITKAREIHDSCLSSALNNRTAIRRYYGSQAIHELLTAGGFSIKPPYRKQFTALLKRTELLAELHAFEFANMSLEKLDSCSRVISMKQHRKDKVSRVQIIRQERNVARRDRNSMLQSEFDLRSLTCRVEKDLSAFIEQAQQCITLLANKIKVTFTGAQSHPELTAIEQGNAAKLWLSIYEEPLTNPAKFLELCLPNHIAKELHTSREMLQFTKIFNMRIVELIKQLKWFNSDLTVFQTMASIVVDRIRALSELGPQPQYAANQLWEAALTSHFNLSNDCPQLNLSGLTMASKLDHKIKAVESDLLIMKKMELQLAEQEKFGKLKSVKKLSFQERLNLMKECA
jgi:3'-phosphoadenosine 5'-phosphosulfate sulfotransferase (PAPS reductase)/FAD synthetase